MTDLAGHRAYLEAELAALRAAPLARRKAMLVALLIDAQVDRLFGAGQTSEDRLAFRASMAAGSAALALVLALCAQANGTRLVIESVPVPLADYSELDVADFMVSLYNGHSVQRLLLVTADGTRHDMLATLEAAVGALDQAV